MIGYYAWPGKADSSPGLAGEAQPQPVNANDTLWGPEIQIEVQPAEYLHPVLNEKAVQFEPNALPVNLEGSLQR